MESTMSSSAFRPKVAVVVPLPEWDLEPLRQAYDIVDLTAGTGRLDGVELDGVRALVTSGGRGAEAALIDALPDLELIAVYGVGYDKVDLEAAARRNVAVTNTPDVLTADVADMALALTLATVRRIVDGDRFVRSGVWSQKGMPLTGGLASRRVGIVGLGRIGEAIARRFAGFDVEIGYCNRSPKTGVPYQAFADPRALAVWADVLVVAVAGGGDTAGLVDAETIEALGPEGYFVNISRGTTVDEVALLNALETGRLGGAGLDVFLGEPDIDKRFAALPNVVLSPHQGSATLGTRQAMGELMRANVAAHFSGIALPTAVLTRR